MKRRSIGWTWVTAVLSDPWAEHFKGMKDEDFTREGLCRYLWAGDFTVAQKKTWLNEVRRKYEASCNRRGVEPEEFPPSLEKQIKKLQSK